MLRNILFMVLLPLPGRTCKMALPLAIGVPGSLDAGQDARRGQGLAEALANRGIAEAHQQRQAAPVRALGCLARFATARQCRSRVLDSSGPGPRTAGVTRGWARQHARALGIAMNAFVIKDIGLSSPINRWETTRGGFGLTLRGLLDDRPALHAKPLRDQPTPGR